MLTWCSFCLVEVFYQELEKLHLRLMTQEHQQGDLQNFMPIYLLPSTPLCFHVFAIMYVAMVENKMAPSISRENRWELYAKSGVIILGC